MSPSYGAWSDRVETAPVADVGVLAGDGALMVIAPHPDDETIACSALLLDAARRKRPVVIVAVTAFSMPNDRQKVITAGFDDQDPALPIGTQPFRQYATCGSGTDNNVIRFHELSPRQERKPEKGALSNCLTLKTNELKWV